MHLRKFKRSFKIIIAQLLSPILNHYWDNVCPDNGTSLGRKSQVWSFLSRFARYNDVDKNSGRRNTFLASRTLTLEAPNSTIFVFISMLNHCYWELHEHLNIKICKCSVSHWTNMSNFHQLEVVGRGSETQLQVDENLKKKTGNRVNSAQVAVRVSIDLCQVAAGNM